MTEDGPDDSTRGHPDVDLAAHPHRRYLLYTLYLSTPPLPLAAVADQITVWETGDAAENHLDRRLRIYMALYHDHLPDLIAADVVAYHQAEDVVDVGPRGHHCARVLLREWRDEVNALLEIASGPVIETE